MCGAKQAAVYEYQKTRKADAAGEFLKGFEGTLVCDGYQVYHTLEDREDTKFEAAGCWTHARRPFAQVVKSLGEKQAAGTVAMEALMQIQTIYHTDNQLEKLPPSERKKAKKASGKTACGFLLQMVQRKGRESGAFFGNRKGNTVLPESGEIPAGIPEESSNTAG